MSGGYGSACRRRRLSASFRRQVKGWLARAWAPWLAGGPRLPAGVPSDLQDLKREPGARILVIAYPPGLGDTLAVTPFLSALGELFPAARISVLAGGEASTVLARHPAVSELIRHEDRWISKDEKRGPRRTPKERRALRDRLRRERFHAVFDLLGNFFSARLAASLRSPLRVGYCSGFEAFLTHPVPDRRFQEERMHMARYHLDLLRHVGLEPGDPPPSVVTGEEEEAFFADLVRACDLPERLVGLAPSSASPENQWPPRRFAEAADGIVRAAGARGILLGAEGGRPVLDAVAAHMRTAPVNLCGKTTVLQAAGVLGHCRCLLTVDTGLMHLGAAVGVKAVALLRTDSPLWRPWGEGHRVLAGPLKEGVPGALRVEDAVRAGEEILEHGDGR
ncbi:MAG: glycosyltransferase family 9 protein [Candidatus Tectomicrobia bacterium]|nr:glycosyltransferase family 9 protein [Candidatus Tectomicrobia bacterium]